VMDVGEWGTEESEERGRERDGRECGMGESEGRKRARDRISPVPHSHPDDGGEWGTV